MHHHYSKMDSNWFSIRVKWVEQVRKWDSRRIKRQGFFFFFYPFRLIYLKFFQELCRSRWKKKKKVRTKNAYNRVDQVNYVTPRGVQVCTRCHQTTQSAKPLTIRILLLENLSSTNAPTRPSPMFCHRARAKSFVPENSALSVARCLVAFLTNWGDEGSLVTRLENKFVRAASLMDRVSFEFSHFAPSRTTRLHRSIAPRSFPSSRSRIHRFLISNF